MNKYIVFLTTVALASCASTERHVESRARVGIDQNKVSVSIQKMKSGDLTTEGGYKQYIVDDYWVDTNAIITKRKKTNSVLKRKITYVSSRPISIEELADDISKASGVHLSLAPEVILGLRTINASIDSKTVSKTEGGSQSKDLSFLTKIRADWVKTDLKEVLNTISTRLNISWTHSPETNTISLYKYRSVSYKVHLSSDVIEQTTQMTNESLVSSGTGSASVSGSAISTSVRQKTDPWNGLIDKLEVIKSDGGRFSADRFNLQITLNDTEQTHATFSKMVKSINKESLREVVFDISLMTVTGKQKDLYGVNYNALYEKSLNAVGFASQRPVESALSTLFGQHIKSNPDHFEGAEIFLDALSSIGKGSIVDNFQRTVLNNGTAPIMLSRNRPYLRKVSIPVSGSNFNQNGEASLTDLVTGFYLTLKPHLINEDDMLVTLNINRRSAPGEFESVDAGAGIFLERPDIQDDSDYRVFKISNNQTKIIAGSIREDVTARSNGTVDNDLWWLGGSQENSNERRMMILFVTARIL